MTRTKLMARAALLAGAVALTAPGAQAQTPFLSSTGCGGGTFLSCAIWSAALTSSNTLQLSVTNTSQGAPAYNSGSMFTQILLGNLGNFTVSSVSTTGAGTWTAVNCTAGSNCGFNGFGLTANAMGAGDTAPTSQNGIGAGENTVFTFTFSAPVSTSDFNGVQLAIHDQGGFAACGPSSKVVFDAASGAALGTQTTCNGTSTVPEPESASLLGLGLTALGGFGGLGRLRRRFRKA